MTRNRNQSLEMLSWKILTHEDRAILRLPIFVIHKHWLAKNDTWDEVMRILAWFLRHLAAGVLPALDHTGAPFSVLWQRQRAGRASRVPGNSRGLGLLQAGPLHAGLAAWLH